MAGGAKFKQREHTIMAQGGTIFKKGPSWFLKYRKPKLNDDGTPGWEHACVKLAPAEPPYTSERSVRPLALRYLNPVNSGELRAEATQRIGEFVENVYFPNVKVKPSTLAGYKQNYEKHLKNRPEMDVRLCDFKTSTAQKLLYKIEDETELSHRSLKNIRALLWAIFTFAKQQPGVMDDIPNPIPDTKIPEGNPNGETYAYSLEEVLTMLEVLPEPAKTIVATAAFTGLRRSEIRGLQWADLETNEEGECQLQVRRSVWNTHIIESTKTEASRTSVPVLRALQKRLEAHRNGYGAEEFIFAGPKKGLPLDLQNLANRVIAPALKDAGLEWHGWHSFRRGLATTLHALGTEDKTIQRILRHSNQATTMNIYVKADPAKTRDALQRVNDAFEGAKRRKKVG
jgi:integrase